MQGDLYELALQTGMRLRAQGLRLVTAESCTGGWIAKTLTDVPGSSEWFEGGLITYSNRMKQTLLDVSEGILNQYGAVSREVVEAMAKGALLKTQAHLSVAVSGIAGPDGGGDTKPVGTVWFAWARIVPDVVQSHCAVFNGDRTQVRYLTVAKALQGIIERLENF
ncbi:MAG: CinA family protein [Gammaproteobacteria bacterium]|nr:CinA family protein [Gammaproteobacteria bacterium]